mgnify:FL=1
MLNISKEQNYMSKPDRQAVANELNKLQKSGATEQQLSDYVAKSGYTDNDFNTNLNGSFEPLTVSPQSKVAGVDYAKPTAAETAESNQYYNNLSSSASVPSGNAPTVTGTSRVTTVTQTTTETFQQSTGGGSTTTFSAPAKDTSASLSYQAQAKEASTLQQAYALNPDSKFGARALDSKLAKGEITQQQYDDIKNSTPEERKAKSLEYNKQYESARDKEEAAKETGQPQVLVKPEPNTSTYTVENTKTITSEVTKVDGDVPGAPNVSTQTVDGVEYQVVNNNDGTESYTEVDDPYGENNTFVEDSENVENSSPESQNYEDYYSQPDQQNFDGYDYYSPPTDDEQDQFEASRLEAEANYDASINNDSVLDDGEDPYYSNGQSTIDANTFGDGGGSFGDMFGGGQGLTSSLFNARSQATQQDSTNAMAKGDWRVRLSLAPGANYLYKGENAGILAPLQETGGVLFPYTPSISVNYAASYDQQELVHANYKNFQYKSSSVDSISIGCEFTAQDTKEARYVLAVIHFFRSVTKMFYGQDQNPKNGVPPPLCYLSGMGAFQFDRHPLAITSFNLSLPTDVDYIRASNTNENPGVGTGSEFFKNNTLTQSLNNLNQSLTKIGFGGISPAPQFKNKPAGSSEATYVPTKIGLTITALPINSRNSISNNFSLRDYGSGQLLRGSKNRTGTGMW